VNLTVSVVEFISHGQSVEQKSSQCLRIKSARFGLQLTHYALEHISIHGACLCFFTVILDFPKILYLFIMVLNLWA
jgi:hypothetical protein